MLQEIRKSLLQNDLTIFYSDYGKKTVQETWQQRLKKQITNVDQFKDYQNINIDNKGLCEIKRGPAGLTMIHRRAYEKLIRDHSDLQIKNYNAISKDAGRYLYNFWETEFKDGVWLGEDVKFCDLAREAGFKFHAVVDGETTHHGNMGYTGKLVDTFQKSNGKAD